MERESFDEWYKTVPADRNDTTNYNLRRAYELAPMEQLERWRTATPEQLRNDESYHLKSMYFDPKTGVGEFMKSKNHPTIQGELDFYNGNSQESRDFRGKYDLDTSGDYYRYVPKNMAQKQNIFANPGQVQGETVDQFVQGRQAANSQTGAVSHPVVTPVNTRQGGGAVMAGGTQYGQQTGGVARTTQPIRSMDDLVSAMYTDPQQEEKLRKASVANQRIMAVGDALRHIGSIFNTVNYAPSQQFNKPWEEERNRYLQEKAYRDKRNQIYMTYQQQKAAQDAKIAQAEREYARKKELDDWTIKKTEQQIKSQQEKDKRMEEMTAAKIAYQQGVIDEKEFNRKVKEYYMRLGLTPTGGALGGSRGRSGGGSGRPTQWQTRYDDFDYANRNGIPVQEETTDMFGNKTTKRRDPNVVHAEVEAHKRKANGQTKGKGKRSSGIK